MASVVREAYEKALNEKYAIPPTTVTLDEVEGLPGASPLPNFVFATLVRVRLGRESVRRIDTSNEQMRHSREKVSRNSLEKHEKGRKTRSREPKTRFGELNEHTNKRGPSFV